MATRFRSMQARRAHTETIALRVFLGIVVAFFGLSFATSANGPAHGSVVEPVAAAAPMATLMQAGDDLIVTGSIGNLFEAGAFSGPNRAEKQDRLRPVVDVAEMVRDFDAIRAQLAAVRKGAEAPNDLEAAAEEPITVAALMPPADAAALDAIDLAAPGDAPVPKMLSTALAYARDEVPATTFDGRVRDLAGKEVSAKELGCLATAIYFEARGESYNGQVAVGQVVMNRLAHRLYPKTICGVVFQNQHKRNACQFSFACDGIPERVTEMKAWAQAEEIAKGVVAGTLSVGDVGNATHYHASYVKPHWAPRMSKVTKVGMHVFYRFKRGWKFG